MKKGFFSLQCPGNDTRQSIDFRVTMPRNYEKLIISYILHVFVRFLCLDFWLFSRYCYLEIVWFLGNKTWKSANFLGVVTRKLIDLQVIQELFSQLPGIVFWTSEIFSRKRKYLQKYFEDLLRGLGSFNSRKKNRH